MITATHEVAAEDVTEVMLLSEEKKWKRRTTKYVTYHNKMAALNAIITDSCLDIYYMVLHDLYLGYANRTPLELVVHFWNTYARDKDPDMSANLDRMMVQWQPPTMLEALFTQLDVVQKFPTRQSSGWQSKTFEILRCWTSCSKTGRSKQLNHHDRNSPSSCTRPKNTGATRQKQPGPPDSQPTSTESPRKKPPSPLP